MCYDMTMLVRLGRPKPKDCIRGRPRLGRNTRMAWVILFFAGLLEVAWALFLKQSEGFTRPGPTLGFAITL
ncbi:MAG: DMT family transporter, partial [Oscillochloridaceae bacterium umkhey_bin13]